MEKSTRIRAHRFFDGLGTAEYDIIRAQLNLFVHRLTPGEILVDEGEQADTFWLLLSGSLQGARCYPDGSSDLVQYYTSGDTVCLDIACTRTRRSLLQISAVSDSEVVAVNYAALMADSADVLTAGPRDLLTGNIMRLLADESIRKQYKIDVLYKKSLRTRILTFLQHMKMKTSSSSFDIGMDREMLAQYLGVNRSALSHELSLMRKDGLIEFRKSRFTLKPDGLKAKQGK
jgi:CRP-like cAMP-binding protein